MNSRNRALAALLLFFAFIPHSSFADGALNPTIRIKLARFFPAGTISVDITSTNPFSITDQNGNSVVQAPSETSYEFDDVNQTSVTIQAPTTDSDSEGSEAGNTVSSLFYTVHSSHGSVLQVSIAGQPSAEHHYRGDIVVLPGLSLVNSLPLEDYLKGVLKPEIGESAPVEALKAQAVAARTYTVRNLGKMSIVSADMDDTTRTQSYLGADGETPAIDQAVDDTSGEVLLYNGTLIDAVYSTDCGGMTAVGSPDEPYLTSVSDPECAAEPPWVLTLTADDASTLLANSGFPGTGEVKIAIVQTDSSGRVTELKISQGDQSELVTGTQFRKLIGYDKLKSTLFKVSEAGDGSLQIVGQGWGHGLGLCQRGAIYLAQHSSLYADILRHYYTGAQIALLDSTMIADPQSVQQISSIPTVSTPTAP